MQDHLVDQSNQFKYFDRLNYGKTDKSFIPQNSLQHNFTRKYEGLNVCVIGEKRKISQITDTIYHNKNTGRVYISNLDQTITHFDIEKAFKKFGEITEIWLARHPSCFGFCVFKDLDAAAAAVREMNNK